MSESLTAHLRTASALSLAAMWGIEVVKLATGSRVAAWAGMAAFLFYFLAALAISRPAQRWMIATVATVTVALTVHFGIPSSLSRGIESAVLFAAFLAAMQMLRTTLESSPVMHAARSGFGALPPRQQHDSLVARTHLLSSVLAAGGLAAVGPLLTKTRPEPERRAFAQSALQGFGLVALWSPLFVAMAVSTRLAHASLAGAVLSGLAMAAIGLLLSHVLYGGRVERSWVLPIRRTILEAAVLAAAIILVNRFWGIGNLEAVVLGIPVLALWIGRKELRPGAGALSRRWVASLATIAVEALVVGAAMVLGEVLKDMISQGMLQPPAGLEGLPVLMLIALPPALMLGTSLVGLHPIISASVLLPILASIPVLHPVVVVGSVLLGWMLTIVLSLFVVPVLYAAALYEVDPETLVVGRNRSFCALFIPLALGYLWALNTWLPK